MREKEKSRTPLRLLLWLLRMTKLPRRRIRIAMGGAHCFYCEERYEHQKMNFQTCRFEVSVRIHIDILHW